MASKMDIVEKVITGVNSWAEFYNNLVALANKDEETYARTVGRGMEQFAKLYFQVSYSKRYTDVLLYDEIPRDLRKMLKLPKKDFGVDLLLKDFENKYTAVQSKFRGKEYLTLNWGKDELSHLLASGNNCDNFCVFSNASDLAKEVKNKMYEKDGSWYVLNDKLKKTDRKFWDAIRLKIQSGIVAPRIALSYEKSRPDQKDCVKAIEDSIDVGEDRGHISVFCGVGKTAESMWVKQRSTKDGLTLFLAPSIALVGQSREEYCEDDALCVCSDADTNDSSRKDVEQLSIGPGVTTNIKEIKEYAVRKPNGIIFCTYHSSSLLIEALGGVKIKLAILDECHRLSGGKNSVRSIVMHDKDNFKIDYRLFMTATVKILPANLKAKISNNELPPVFSMDNESDFGKRLYSLNLREAINLGIVTDYKIETFGITNDEIKHNIVLRHYLKLHKNGKGKYVKDGRPISYDMMANVLGMAQYIKKKPQSHSIVYHNGIKESILFKDLINEVLGFACAEHVDGKMGIKERNEIVENFKNKSCAIITNDSVMKEGIDIKKVDTIVFCANKRSRIDIVQSMGRAVRRDWDNIKKTASIVIPMYVTKKKITEKMIENSAWKTMIYLLKALGEIDYTAKAWITKINVAKGKAGKLITKELEEAIKIGIIDFNNSDYLKNFFIKDITDRIKGWEYWYALLEEFYKEFGHCMVLIHKSQLGNWVNTQRQFFKNGKLLKDRIDKLNKLNFSWNFHQDNWNKNCQLLCEYKKKNGHCDVLSDDGDLGQWVSWVRTNQENLDKIQINKLKEIGFEFGAIKDKRWNKEFKLLVVYAKKNGHCNPTESENKVLNRFVGVNKHTFKKGKLNKEKETKLRNIGFDFENLYDITFEKNLKLLADYKKENGNCNVPQSYRPILGIWVSRLRGKRANLTKEQKEKLDKLGLDFKPQGNATQMQLAFNRNFKLLLDYKKEHGNCNVLVGDGSLGNTCSHLRVLYKNGKLSKENENKLRKLGFDFTGKFNMKYNNSNSPIRKQKMQRIFDMNLKKWTEQNKINKLDKFISSWTTTQRIGFNKGVLEDWKIKKLNDAKFIFNARNEIFNEFYAKLVEFKKKYGHANVASNYENRNSLAGWVVNLRVRFRQGKLEKKEIQKLKEIGFIFDGKKAAKEIHNTKQRSIK